MPNVIGREIELDALHRFIDAIPKGPCALVFEGEAGIGKTTLWDAGVAQARERSFRVLSARSTASEGGLSYVGLFDVLHEVPEEALASLPEVQRRAVEVALLRVEPDETPVDHRTVAAGALGVLRWLSSTAPVLLALDDTQWMDATSRQALGYAIRRFDGEPIWILTAMRLAEGSDDPLDIARALPEDRLSRLQIGPLSVEATGRMLRERLGGAPSGSALLDLHVVSGGNPLFALEIAKAMLKDPERGFSVPRNLQEQVSRGLRELPEDAREVLVVAAALARPTVEIIERVVDRLDDALGSAVRAGVVEAQGGAVRFTHPLYASVAYADATQEDRARIHGRLAELVTDPEERARHLALSSAPPDAGVADALDDAAAHARARGAPMVAAELRLEARRYTAADRTQDRHRRALLASDDLYEGEEMGRVFALLEDELPTCPAGRVRAEVLWRLGRAALSARRLRPGMFEPWLKQAEEESGGDPWLGSAIHLNYFWIPRLRYQYAAAARHARLALEMAQSAGDPAATAASLAMVAWAEMVAGHGVASALVQRAFEAWGAADRTPSGSVIAAEEHPGVLCGEVLLYADRVDEARTVYQELQQEARDRGSDKALSIAFQGLCELELLAGNWHLASRHLDDLRRLRREDPLLPTYRGEITAHLGRADESRRDLIGCLEFVEPREETESLVWVLAALGFLELSLGNLTEAHRHLSRVTGLFMDAGILEPGIGRFLPDAIETLVGLGEFSEAERLTGWLEERGRALDRVWALAVGARCRGLLLAAEGDHEAALEHLERAMTEHERLPMPFERARTLLVLGSVRRRAGRKRAARDALGEGLEIFERLGAALWAEKARAELSAIGGRTAATGELTPMETRVARLAAAGRTNREIAETLYLSVRTVETHLSHAYRKLDVRSRTELTLALDASEA